MAKTLMIIDDSATMRKIIMRTVRMSGLEFDRIEEAGNGAEALEKLGAEPLDIVLCDINMPNMDGLQLLKTLHERTGLGELCFIMITTEASRDRATEAIQLGARGYVRKPFTAAEITGAIQACLQAG